jgi:hypothetical protein
MPTCCWDQQNCHSRDSILRASAPNTCQLDQSVLPFAVSKIADVVRATGRSPADGNRKSDTGERPLAPTISFSCATGCATRRIQKPSSPTDALKGRCLRARGWRYFLPPIPGGWLNSYRRRGSYLQGSIGMLRAYLMPPMLK